MAHYFITYDLRNTRDYKTLYDALENFNAIQILESTWSFTRVNTTAEGLRDYFRQFIDHDDGLLIAESNTWATYRTNDTPHG